MEIDFSGAKAAVFVGASLVVLRRDDRPDIPWPGRLDFPGGGREPGETPEATVLREIEEEIGLRLDVAELVGKRRYESESSPVYFFAAFLPVGAESRIVFGNEGQGWALMSPQDYIAHPDHIPHLAERLTDVLRRFGARLTSP